MTATDTKLDEAREAIAKEDWKTALERLLEAWRSKRAVRLAELVELVSRRLPVAVFTGKTVKARIEAWLATASKRDPADVGSLLATAWPLKWPDALTIVNGLAAYPDDPRIALAIARHAASLPFDTVASGEYYRTALAVVRRAGDTRAKPLLEEARERLGKKPLAEPFSVALTELHAPPALTPSEETALAALESSFVSESQAEKTADDFMAAIYAAPEDDNARAVYADWLTERGDPRGEFISLQLAAPSAASKKREAALLRQHGRVWAGALNRVLHKDGRVFTRGFLSRGIIHDDRARNTAQELHHPDWALVESLAFVGLLDRTFDALVEAPGLRSLRSLTGLEERFVARLAKLGAQLEEVHVEIALDVEVTPELTEQRRAIVGGLPNLKRLLLGGNASDVFHFILGPFPTHLERLVLIGWIFPIASAIRAIEQAERDVAIVEARERHCESDQYWHFELPREASGHFTRLTAGPDHPDSLVPSPAVLMMVLRTLPELTALRVTAGSGCAWERGQIQEVEAIIGAMPALREVDVPWDRGIAAPPSVRRAPLKVSCTIEPGFPRDVDAIWASVTSPPLSMTFDSFAVNYGGHETLDDDGLEHVKRTLAKKRTTHLLVYRKRDIETTQMMLLPGGFEVTSPRGPGFDLDAWLASLVALINQTNVDAALGPFLVTHEDGRVRELVGKRIGPFGETLRWLWVLGPSLAEIYPFDAVAEAARVFEGGRVVRSEHHLLVVTSPAPEQFPPDEQREAFAARLDALFWKQHEQRRGWDPAKLAATLLGAALEARGFVASGPSWTRDGGTIELEYGVVIPDGDVWMRTSFRRADGRRNVEHITRDGAVATSKLATAALEAFVARLDTMLPWLDAS